MPHAISVNDTLHMMPDITMEQLEIWKKECKNRFPTDKKYQIIYADPPWKYERHSTTLANQCESHYPVMSIEELKDLDVGSLAHKDCALFLWTSNPILPKATMLIEHWGFEYKTVFKVWRKINQDGSNVMVPGWWSRSNTELLLVATKGSPLKKYKTANHCEQQEYSSVRTVHSEKPHEIRESIENFMKVDDKIELFARKITSEWDAWGLEVPGFYHECDNPIIIQDGKRSIGIQVDIKEYKTKKKNTSSGTGSGIPAGHKIDCTCCICKKRNKA